MYTYNIYVLVNISTIVKDGVAITATVNYLFIFLTVCNNKKYWQSTFTKKLSNLIEIKCNF